MKINISGATFSSIVGIGQKVKKAAKDSGNEYLELNRGVNLVVGIDLSKVVGDIDFNGKELQLYAPNLGIDSLKETIQKEYFPNYQEMASYVSITPGGMPALDLIIQMLDVKTIYFPQFYWGSYSKMATIRNKSFSFYKSLDSIDISSFDENSCIFICDPNNPTGIKIDDLHLLTIIRQIADTGAVIIYDCPYRKLFYNNNFFEQLLHPNIIIAESFSKWTGLPGARLGFIASLNKEFNKELNIRLLYQFNAVSSVSQVLINTLLCTVAGRKAIEEFQKETRKHIKQNIQWLEQNNFLVEDIYNNQKPLGIFAIVNRSEDYLFDHKIGAVGLDKFVYHDKDTWSIYSRICVSVNHGKFVEFMKKV
jgi:aspartate/methionine/tyrosine aminotransferase